MEPVFTDEVLRSLQPTPWGWSAVIPGAIFLAQPVSLRIDSRNAPLDDPPPTPNSGEMALARLILTELPKVLAEAETQYRNYHGKVVEAIERSHEPHVWLSRSCLARDGANCWQFVVGIQDAEDYGTHIEFDGLLCRGTWSGD